MADYNLKIELLSDLCVSDGGVYNSAVDTDICHDSMGFPYIPAKRIKGCLRESALELCDWGEKISINKIFGEAGAKALGGALKINDAYVEDVASVKEEINAGNPMLFHPQNVLNQFSYLRTQTSIDSETGIAKEGSLRTIRVANKGLVFVAKLSIPDELIEDFKKICANLTNMGMNRTRGLGEVKLSIETAKNESICIKASASKSPTVLEYEMVLETPVICKNVLGAESNTNDYIDGSKILGIFAEQYRKKYAAEIVELFENGDMEFSNAYISKEHIRYTEVPGYIYKIKNNNQTYVNSLYNCEDSAGKETGETRQLNGMKHTYVLLDEDGSLHKADVAVEQRYHHRRPEDKSIGRAAEDSTGNSMFYQMSSISAGQTFKGFIKGTTEQIRIIEDLLIASANARIGYGSSSEYGSVRFVSLEEHDNDAKETAGNKMLVRLISPAIVYGKNASYSTNTEDLKNEIAAGLGQSCDAVKIKRQFVHYVPVGGYNVTWNCRKPTVMAFDKGSALLLEIDSLQPLKTCDYMFLGERNVEGFGEYVITPFAESNTAEFSYATKDKAKDGRIGNVVDVAKSSFAASVAASKYITYVKSRSNDFAKAFAKETNRATVSNMLVMCSENDTFTAVSENAIARYSKGSNVKQQKKTTAANICDIVSDKYQEIIDSFKSIYGISGFGESEEDKEKLKYLLLKSLLINIKYAIRNPEKKGEA